MTRAGEERREHAAHQRRRQGQERRATPAASYRSDACSSRKIAIAARDQEQQSALRGLALRYSPSNSAWYPAGSSMAPASPRSRATTSRDRGPRTWRRRRGGASRPRAGRRSASARSALGDVAQPDPLAVGRIDRQLADGGQVVAGWRACSRPLTSYALPPRKMSPTSSPAMIAGRAADVAGLQAVPLRRGEVDLDLDLRDVDLRVDVLVDDARRCRRACRGPPRPSRAGRPGPAPKRRTTIGVAGAGEHLVDPLPQVGLHVAAEARVARDDLLDLGDASRRSRRRRRC